MDESVRGIDRRVKRWFVAAGVLAVCNLALIAFLLLGAPEQPVPAATATPTPELPVVMAATQKKPLTPGLYYFQNSSHLAGQYTDPQLTGSQLEVMWTQVNNVMTETTLMEMVAVQFAPLKERQALIVVTET